MLWIKALHIIAVICWFAGLFYLPRLYVYHAMSTDEISNERFKVMERKLYRGIMTPSAITVLVFGVIMLLAYPLEALRNMQWLQLKLVLVALVYGYHFHAGTLLTKFAADQNTHSHRWLRVYNELPVLILVAIVILAVVKPF